MGLKALYDKASAFVKVGDFAATIAYLKALLDQRLGSKKALAFAGSL
jgi:hypothetical protein